MWTAGTALAVVAAVSVAAGQAPEPAHKGTVVDTHGRPIAGVTVNAAMFEVVETAADGTFRLKERSDVVRFFKDGYRPATRLAETFTDRVVLEPSTARPRILPTCDGPRAGRQDVADLHLPTPREARRHRVDGDDSFMSIWEFRNGRLRHGYGPMWSYGFPLGEDLRGLEGIVEVDVRRPMQRTPDLPADEHLVYDIRGTKPNGRRYRFVGMFMETFQYDVATLDEATFFDRMLDAMCYVPRTF
jgi:hypothetical protein